MFYPVDDLRDRPRSALSPQCGNPNISTCKGRSRTFFAFSQGPEGLVCRTAGRAFHLYFGQYVDNDYVRTKFLAERAILEARIEKGLDAVILRAGNLMGRYSDGEFQINLLTNAFMRSLVAFHHLGACPISALADTVELSPIDATAEAVLALAGVNSMFSIFHINNNHIVTMGDIIFALKRYGLKIDIVTEREFAGIMQEASGKDAFSEAVASLVAYDEGGKEKITVTENDNYFTISALYRLGFKWPIVDDSYLEKVISAVDTLGFFDDTL